MKIAEGYAPQRGQRRLLGASLIAAAMLMSSVAYAQTLNIAMNNNGPPTLDPKLAREGNTLTYYQPVYDPLLRRMPDGEIVPWLATEWSYNDDKTALTLKLRDDVTFVDGEAFNADVAKANLDAFRTGGGPDSPTLANVSEVVVVDPTTIEIQLKAPDPGLLIFLSNAAGLQASPAAIGTEGIATSPVGSGPYVLDTETTVFGAQWSYVRNEDYWNPEIQKFERINIIPMPNTTARLNALISGEIDAALMSPETAAAAEGAGLLPAITQINWNGLGFLDRDGKIVPEMADPRVRQAIIHAIDREAIFNTIYGGRGIMTEQVFNPVTAAYLEEYDGYSVYPYDPERARELLAEAGLDGGFTIPMGKNSDDPPDIYAAVSDYLAEVGITLEITEMNGDDLRTQLFDAQWPFWEASMFMGSDWISIRTIIASDALFNPFENQTDETNGYISTIQVAEGDELETAAEALNRYLVENAWFMPILRADRLVFHNARITLEPQIQQSMPSIYNYAPAE